VANLKAPNPVSDAIITILRMNLEKIIGSITG
jgi:hypothetical protein